MEFRYCPHCGTKAALKETGDEGLVPWCPACQQPLFPMFSACIITLAVDEEAGEAALLRQSYISTRYHNLVSGYIKPGESAEECAAREVEEELGLKAERLTLTGTYWFDKKDMLMIGFIAQVRKQTFHLSGEVDQAAWVPLDQVLGLLHPYPAISYRVAQSYIGHRNQTDPATI